MGLKSDYLSAWDIEIGTVADEAAEGLIRNRRQTQPVEGIAMALVGAVNPIVAENTRRRTTTIGTWSGNYADRDAYEGVKKLGMEHSRIKSKRHGYTSLRASLTAKIRESRERLKNLYYFVSTAGVAPSIADFAEALT